MVCFLWFTKVSLIRAIIEHTEYLCYIVERNFFSNIKFESMKLEKKVKKIRMKNKYIIKIFFLSLLLLTGCEEAVDNERDNIISAALEAENEEEDCLAETEELRDNESIGEAAMDSEELLDAFLAGGIPAYYDNGADTIWMSDLPYNEEDWYSYTVGERIDLDNDGENEQIVDGPNGGMYFDARDGKVYVLEEGWGTAGVLSYTYYDNAVWIVHSDILHGGREMYWLTKYVGGENIADEFLLSAEYWYSPDGRYHEDSDFTYRDKEISMTEYEELRKEIFGW